MTSEHDDLVEIWRTDRARTLARVDALDRAAVALARGELDAELRRLARVEAHTLAGTAAIFGLADASRLARECERLLDDAVPLAAADAARLRSLARDLRQALERDPS